MTTSIEAVYEGGVLRLKEPLALAEGTPVRVAVSTMPNGSAMTLEPLEPATQANATPRRTPAEIMAEIAALPEEGDGTLFSGAQHDEVLYSWKKAQP